MSTASFPLAPIPFCRASSLQCRHSTSSSSSSDYTASDYRYPIGVVPGDFEHVLAEGELLEAADACHGPQHLIVLCTLEHTEIPVDAREVSAIKELRQARQRHRATRRVEDDGRADLEPVFAEQIVAVLVLQDAREVDEVGGAHGARWLLHEERGDWRQVHAPQESKVVLDDAHERGPNFF